MTHLRGQLVITCKGLKKRTVACFRMYLQYWERLRIPQLGSWSANWDWKPRHFSYLSGINCYPVLFSAIQCYPVLSSAIQCCPLLSGTIQSNFGYSRLVQKKSLIIIIIIIIINIVCSLFWSIVCSSLLYFLLSPCFLGCIFCLPPWVVFETLLWTEDSVVPEYDAAPQGNSFPVFRGNVVVSSLRVRMSKKNGTVQLWT